MIFPIGDDNVQGGYKPIFSYLFILLNIAIFMLQLSTEGQLICDYAAIPMDIKAGQNYQTLITSMFLHGGWMHLAGNMLFLWIFADNIESTIGNIKFLLFYLLGGLAASALHIYLEPDTSLVQNCCLVCSGANPCQTNQLPCPGSIPSLGASGAISAVMGAYLVMFPRSRIKMLFIFIFRPFYIPAFVFLLFWFGEQVLSGIGVLTGGAAQAGGVAWWAHIGGFVVGLIFGAMFKGSGGKKKLRKGFSEYV